MKFLIISNMYPSKKAPHYGVFVKNLNEQLEQLGHQYDLIKIKKQKNIILKLLNYFKLVAGSIFLILFKQYDYVYLHYPSMTGIIPEIIKRKKIKKIKIISNFHGNDLIPEVDHDKRFQKVSQSLLDISEKIIVPSDYFYNEAEKRMKSSNNLFILPSGGVDMNRFYPQKKYIAKKKLNLKNDIEYIGFVSRIEKNKGWDIFIEAFSHVIKKYPNLKAIMVGDGKEYASMIKMINEKKISESIILKKMIPQEELNNYFNSFSIFCFPTMRKSESLGLVGLEAMATKTLVIASDKFGPTSYIKNEHNGFLFEMGNSEDLALKIDKVFQLNEEKKLEIQNKAYENVLKYSAATTLNELEYILKKE